MARQISAAGREKIGCGYSAKGMVEEWRKILGA
jgi:hypothetical protein